MFPWYANLPSNLGRMGFEVSMLSGLGYDFQEFLNDTSNLYLRYKQTKAQAAAIEQQQQLMAMQQQQAVVAAQQKAKMTAYLPYLLAGGAALFLILRAGKNKRGVA